jgi:hypothetical protein
MMIEESHRRARSAIAAHFTGAVAPAAEREMRTHLPGCADCHSFYEQHLLLSSLDPAGLSSEVRLARGLGLRPERRQSRLAFGWWSLCGATFAALVLFLVSGRSGLHLGGGAAGYTAAANGVEARGGPASVAAARTPEVQIYRFAQGAATGAAERASDVVHAGDELAFAYRNPGGSSRLLVFAVDEHGHVYWYHPGWSDAADNPTAVPISSAPGLHELPAAVLHKFDGERIMIHALFTDREISVRQIEGALAASAAHGQMAGVSAPLTLPGATDVVRPMRILP